jgi:hypothetical protein
MTIKRRGYFFIAYTKGANVWFINRCRAKAKHDALWHKWFSR